VSAVQLPDPVTVLDGELDVKKIKSFEKNVELEFDDDNAILTATDINLNGAVASSGDIKVYDPTAVNLDQSILKKDRLEFRGDPINTSVGSINYQDGTVRKVISLMVDKGDFQTDSQARIFVDGAIYYFYSTSLDMNNKKIIELVDPTSAQDAATKNYVDLAFVDPVINSSITLENQTTPNTLQLASFATGDNRINSSGNLEINGSNLTMNLTAGTLTENVGLNKISIISGNLTETISANKVTNISATHISTASSHTFNGALTSSTSVTTPLISGVSTITNASDININNIAGELIISNNGVVINSAAGINMTATNGGIQVGGGRITTTNVAFTNPQEMVSKRYIDDLQATIVKFDTTVDTILYEDNNIKISYLTADAQPSFELKIAPAGPGAFGTWVDTSISFIGGGSFSGDNGDATNTIGVKAFFYGSTTIDPNYDHRNYGVTSRCILCAETDLTYPTYELTLITGNIANLGVSKVEVY